jgi:4-amino-4-deoxy-L-arabinose transferase-like glycosyltransferase
MIAARTEKILACALALVRLVFCAYRAVHQSITVDEAYTYIRFVSGSWANLVGQYDANNHVLHSILVKLSTQVFGLSELSVRLPSLLSGFFLILGVFWVLLRITSPIIRWVTIVALSLHPLLLDFSIAARGYGMGLAFLIWAIYCCMRRRYLLGGTLLGLGISANLTIAFPALALMLAVMILEDDSVTDRLKIVAAILAPAETLFVLICFASLRTAGLEHFYVGSTTIRDWLSDLVHGSIKVAHRNGLFGTESGARVILWILLPLIGAFILIAAGVDFRHKWDDRLRFVPLLTLVVSLFGLIAAHLLFGLNYPVERTGLYFVPLFGIAWAIAADRVMSRPLAGMQAVIAGLLILQFATQLQTQYFAPWKFDMDTKQVALMLQKASQGKADQSIAVSSDWRHQPAMEFYRQDLHLAALKPIERQDQAALSGFDFYVLQDPDRANLETNHLRVRFSDPQTGIVLADHWGRE